MSEQALFRLDLNRCTGCAACVVACRNENPVSVDLSWRNIFTFNELHLPGAATFHYSLACNHCGEPACLRACPAVAYRKDPATGAVLLDGDRCIGCRYCSWACPYGAPQYDPASGLMEKCTFCSHRLEQELEPACVVSCPVEALGFTPRGEPGPLRRPGLPEIGLEPGLLVTEKRRAAAPPAMVGAEEQSPRRPRRPPEGPGLSLREEWPLLIFTLLATWIVAWFAASLDPAVPFSPWVFVGLGALALSTSTLHLGRPLRAWRAVLDLRSSWLSREIVLFNAFFFLAVGQRLFGISLSAATWSTVALGFVALFAVDKVYDLPGLRWPALPHSAMCTLTATLYVGLLTREPLLALSAGVLKALLFFTGSRELGASAVSVRVGVGLILPFACWALWPEAPVLSLPALAFAGELLDRISFYRGLRFPSPARQIEHDLAG